MAMASTMSRHHRFSQKMHLSTISQVGAIYYPTLAAIGIPANLVTVVILSQGNVGLTKGITGYLLAMAVADLLALITDVIFNRINDLYFPTCFLDYTPLCSLKFVLVYAALDTSVWLTVVFTFDRFVAICCQQLKRKYCTEKTAAGVIGVVAMLFCAKNARWYFTYQPLYVINNVPWFCDVKLSFYDSAAWVTFDWIDTILTPCVPFLLILTLNVLTVRHIVVASKARQGFQAQRNGDNRHDPEMQNRRKSIILLFAVSGSFMLLWATHVAVFLYWRITQTYSYETLEDPFYIALETGYMLQVLSSCTNTYIYAVTQTKFREQLKSMAKRPFVLVHQLIK
ncbi:probable G-protein coupled receptor 139 [Rhincodon typus]|uniref:probable G-protein coupled receptor 139 n=1 Tax=Rhincodon typus TaxID=259920 RepID=UPI002030E410|nr:probable G-protein coupled receptor 139 [Rhincodon typus]